MPRVVSLDTAELRSQVKVHYSAVADHPNGDFHFRVGRPAAEWLGYPAAVLDRLPPTAVESFAGVGNPFSLGPLRPGEVVVDLGSGAGFDCLVAAEHVGPAGRVIGVDMTGAMLNKAAANAAAAGHGQVEFREGYLEDLPLPDASVDVVISNGVLNLCPDKARVYREMYRVLRPGGRFQVADIINHVPLSERTLQRIDLWCD